MRKIDSIESFNKIMTRSNFTRIAFQSLDFTDLEELLLEKRFHKCLFLDCVIPSDLLNYLNKNENYIFPNLDVPYTIYPSKLYNKDSLYNGYNPEKPETYQRTLDKIVYDYYKKIGAETTNIKETLARALHDHSINDEMTEFLGLYDEKRIVAIMGGHQLGRDDEMFVKVAFLSKILTEKGFLMISGGGPGAMEATHLGAWLAGKTDKTLSEAVEILSQAPVYSHPDWLKRAYEVIEKYPNPTFSSLGIPTWLYGHELSTPFATHIAKFFENSLREEGLLAVAKGGVVFAPGSAGTMQEIFQDLTQNHYASYGYPSPMVFFDKKFWTEKRPIYPLLKTMKERGDLSADIILEITDDITEIVACLEKIVNGE